MDNSGTRKEGVSRTYKGCDGYAPMPAYLSQEGYYLEFKLREGKRIALFSIQHQREWRGYEYSVRRVMRVVECTIDKKRKVLLTPEIELEGLRTSLSVDEKNRKKKHRLKCTCA